MSTRKTPVPSRRALDARVDSAVLSASVLLTTDRTLTVKVPGRPTLVLGYRSMSGTPGRDDHHYVQHPGGRTYYESPGEAVRFVVSHMGVAAVEDAIVAELAREPISGGVRRANPEKRRPAARRNPDKSFVPDEIVRYTGAFLRSVGMVAGAPINGRVISVEYRQNAPDRVRVQWNDMEDGDSMTVLATNLEHDPRARRAARSNPRLYVNVYYKTLERGGSEEGGWYYDQFEPVEGRASHPVSNETEAERAKARLEAEYAPMQSKRPYHSVLPGTHYAVRIEKHPARFQPAHRPRYE